MDLDTKVKIIGGIISAIVGVIGIMKGIVPAYQRWQAEKQKKIEKEQLEEAQYSNLITALQSLKIDVKQVKDKIFPNGGSSLFDGITRLERNVALLNAKVDGLEDTNKITLNMQKVAFWVSEQDGKTTYVSPALCRLLNRPESELLDNNWISCLVKRDVERISAAWHSAIREKRTFDEIFSYTDGDNPSKEIRVHALVFHKLDKGTGDYLGSYGTLTEQ